VTATEAIERGAASLSVANLYASYGDLAALRGVSINVPSGSCVAVLGANGAGKSTLLNAIAGLLRPIRGHITLGSERIDQLRSHKIVRQGICYIPQGRGVFPDLTVTENLRLSIGRNDADFARVFAYFPVLEKYARRIAGELSGGEQQMLATAPALVNDYRILMVDELSMGLAPIIVDMLYDLLTTTREQGKSMLLVEQFAERSLGLADTAYVLRKGEVVFDGEATLLRADEDLLHTLYIGEER
jgi:branched-chain amino acid transport system ATP-binding protein